MNNDLERIIRGQGALDWLYSRIRRHRNLCKSLQLQMFQLLDWDIYFIINVRVFIKNSSTVEPPLKIAQNAKARERLGEVVAYENQTARAKVLTQSRKEWYIYSKKIRQIYFPLTITGSFYDKIISYSMWQFIYGSAINWFVVKNFYLCRWLLVQKCA